MILILIQRAYDKNISDKNQLESKLLLRLF